MQGNVTDAIILSLLRKYSMVAQSTKDSTVPPMESHQRVPKSGKKKKKHKRKSDKAVSAPFPLSDALPAKIQRRIFEWSYYQDYTNGPSLALVSRKTKEWIEPLIYQYIIIDRFDRVSPRPDLLWRTFSGSSKSKEFFRDHVKGILVNGSIDPVVTDLLSACINISSFACYAQGPLPDTILEKLASIFSTEDFSKLRRLSISGLGFESEDIGRPFFQNLTHLAVDTGDNHRHFPWRDLKCHLRLTHILIDIHFELHEHAPLEFKTAILDILRHAPPTLRCLIVLVDWDRLYESSFQKKCDRDVFSDAINGVLDKRVVVAADTGSLDEINVTVLGEDPVQFLEYIGFVALTPDNSVPWVCPPDGARRDIWERAEDVLQRRNVGQIT